MIGRILAYIRQRKNQRSRRLFRFHDGKRMRAVDPIEVQIALELHPKLNLGDYALLNSDDPDTTMAYAEGICDAFGVNPWNEVDGSGLTIGERLALLEDYWDFCEDLKKNIGDGLTLPQPTEPISSPDVQAVPSTTTSCSAASG